MAALNAVIKEELDYLRSISDLPLKMMHLISWRKTVVAERTGSILVWFNADPRAFFKLKGLRVATQIGNDAEWENGTCVGESSWSYADGVYRLTFNGVADKDSDEQVFLTNADCTTFNYEKLGFTWDYPTEDFHLDVDMAAAVTVVSLYHGIITVDDLVNVTELYFLEGDSSDVPKMWLM